MIIGTVTRGNLLDLEIEKVKIDSLAIDPNNVRVHDTTNLVAIKASLLRFGQVEPLVVRKSTGIVVGGNGRIDAMKQLGWTECDIVRIDLSDEEATALAIALNRTAELATWDQKALDKQLASLDEELRNIAFLELETSDFAPGSEDDQGQ